MSENRFNIQTIVFAVSGFNESVELFDLLTKCIDPAFRISTFASNHHGYVLLSSTNYITTRPCPPTEFEPFIEYYSHSAAVKLIPTIQGRRLYIQKVIEDGFNAKRKD